MSEDLTRVVRARARYAGIAVAVTVALIVALLWIAHLAPAFGGIIKSVVAVVAVTGIVIAIRDFTPRTPRNDRRHGDRRHGDRRHRDDDRPPDR